MNSNSNMPESKPDKKITKIDIERRYKRMVKDAQLIEFEKFCKTFKIILYV